MVQAVTEMKDASLLHCEIPNLAWTAMTLSYVGVSHTYRCGILFSFSQVYTRIEADKFLPLFLGHLPAGFITIGQDLIL